MLAARRPHAARGIPRKIGTRRLFSSHSRAGWSLAESRGEGSIMTTTTSVAGGRRWRDPDDDVDTRVYVRPEPHAWDRMMVVRIMRRSTRPSKPAEPNVFLTPAATDPPPPWTVPSPLEKTVSRVGLRTGVVRRRSILPWVTFAMTFSIAFGVLSDPVLRQETSSQLQSSAIRLYRLVSRIRT